MRSTKRLSAICTLLVTLFATASFSPIWAADVFPFGQTLDLGGAAANTADVSAFESLGSIFFNVDSATQDSGVNDAAFPPFGDEDLRSNLPAYLTAGPGAEYIGTSGGWGYQQILVGDGNTPDPFEAGVAISAGEAGNNAGELLTFTAGAGVVPDIRFGVVVDILDGAAFVPEDVTVSVGGNSATTVLAAGNQIGDIYQFDVTGIVPGDVISISVGNAPAFTSTIAGVTLDVAEPFPLEMIVNTSTGNIFLENNSAFGTTAEIQGYSIESLAGSLNPAGWNSLQEQGFDGGNTNPNDGIGWEELGPGTANLVGEFKLDGTSEIPAGSQLSLGQLFSPGGVEDLLFSVSTGSAVVPISAITYIDDPVTCDLDGSTVCDVADLRQLYDDIAAGTMGGLSDLDGNGIVNNDDIDDWLAAAGIANGKTYLPGDTDLDGNVGGPDFTTLALNFGETGLPNAYWEHGNFDGNTGGGFSVGGPDFTALAFNFGFTSVNAVPEPASLAPFGMAAIVLFGFLRRRRKASEVTVALLLATMTGVVFVSTTEATTNDRVYLMGDEDNDSGIPTAGSLVGSATSTGDTFDSEGMIGDGSFVDLTPSGSPVYGSTTGRPLQAGSGLGIDFDGVDDYVAGERLGLPETSFSGAGGANVGPFDYSGIANRGIQFWVNPSSAGQGNGLAQSIIADTNQHAVRISDNDTWVMRYAGEDFESGVSVNFNTWSHVMLVRPFGPAGPNNGSRLYVNGVAVAAASGGYDGAEDTNLVIGAGTGEMPGGDFFSGIVDDVEMFVMGTSIDTSMNYGTFDFATDNDYADGFTVANGGLSGLVLGDLTGDGMVLGDGSGPVGTDDVSAFVANWRNENLVNGIRVADVGSPSRGDFNFDGFTNISDWLILDANYQGTSQLNLQELLEGVPEPSAACLLLPALFGLGMLRRQRPKNLVMAASFLAVVGLVGSLTQSTMAAVTNPGNSFGTNGDLTAAATGWTFDGGSLFFNADSSGQDDRVNDPAFPPFGDDELRNNLPAYITAGPGVDYAGVSGGWGYQQILDDFGPSFESGVAAVAPDAGNNLITLTVQPGFPSGGLQVGVVVDNVDNAAFSPASIAVSSNGDTLSVPTTNIDLNSDIYVFNITDVGVGDTIDIDVTNNGTFPTIAGLLVGSITPFMPPEPILTVNRDTGNITLSNPTNATIDMVAYEMESSAGALNPNNWLSIADNYDADSGGSVDNLHNWIEFTPSTDRDNLAEAQLPAGDGANFTSGLSIDLGNAWIKSPVEDVSILVALADGSLLDLDVQYTGNNGQSFVEGDITFNGVLDVDDWNAFKVLVGTDTTGLSGPEAYQLGDFNDDGRVNLLDANQFAMAYDSVNGAGAFEEMLQSIPEPSSGMICAFGLLALGLRLRQRR